MKHCIFDTETNGMFDFSLPADDPSQPRLAWLYAILVDETLDAVEVIDLKVKPDGWSMTPEATEVNGLTDEILEAEGVPVADVLDAWNRLVDEGYEFFAFNARFDAKQMRAELRRAERDDRFEETKNGCLMIACRGLGVKKMNGKGGQPRLIDCTNHFGIDHENPHQGKDDTWAAYEIYKILAERGDLPEAKVHYAKNRPE